MVISLRRVFIVMNIYEDMVYLTILHGGIRKNLNRREILVMGFVASSCGDFSF